MNRGGPFGAGTSDPRPPIDRMPVDHPDGRGDVRSWSWGRDEDRRPHLPWIGIFLVIFGALLLLNRYLPDYRSASSLVVLAAGLAFLAAWALRRGTLELYAGAFLTAAAVPGIVSGFGYDAGPGLGTVAFGVAFVFVAAVRVARGGGWGWQALFGLVLLAVGIPELALPDLASLVLPVLLVVLGVALLARGGRRAS